MTSLVLINWALISVSSLHKGTLSIGITSDYPKDMFWFKNNNLLKDNLIWNFVVVPVWLREKNTWAQLFKLTTSLANVSLKLWSLNMACMLIFLLKKCE